MTKLKQTIIAILIVLILPFVIFYFALAVRFGEDYEKRDIDNEQE